MSRIKRVMLLQPASAGGNFEYVAIPRQGMLYLSAALAQWDGPFVYEREIWFEDPLRPDGPGEGPGGRRHTDADRPDQRGPQGLPGSAPGQGIPPRHHHHRRRPPDESAARGSLRLRTLRCHRPARGRGHYRPTVRCPAGASRSGPERVPEQGARNQLPGRRARGIHQARGPGAA